jgi:membrane fusion protein (multidrug efflux system)
MNDASPVLTKSATLLKRVRHFVLLLLGPVLIAGGAGWLYLHGGRFVTTDNAYVKADIIGISSNVTGTVMEVLARTGDYVHKGDLLLTVDDKPYLIAQARAEANLANVRGDIESMKAEFVNKGLEIAKAQNDLSFQEQELERIRGLHEKGSISGVQFDQAVYARDAAERVLAEKNQALQVVKARLIDPNAATDDHPRVKQALAELDKANFDLQHVLIKSPADGVIVNGATFPGENIIGGAPVMNLVSDERLWLEANFKETELRYMHVGQPVSIKIDTYPDLDLHGKVAIIAPATGAEFSLLPAQNSSGNWVKVVQRLAVVITFDTLPDGYNIAAGMSAEVSVDTGHQRELPNVGDLVSR